MKKLLTAVCIFALSVSALGLAGCSQHRLMQDDLVSMGYEYEVVFDLLHETAYQGCGLGLTILGPESNIKKCGLSSLFIVGLRVTTSSTTFTRTTPLPAWWLPEPAPSTTKT